MILRNGSARVLLYGAEYQTRSDGTDAFVMASVHSSDADILEGVILTDADNEQFRVMSPVVKGFHFSGILLEWIM